MSLRENMMPQLPTTGLPGVSHNGIRAPHRLRIHPWGMESEWGTNNQLGQNQQMGWFS
jgi:hypothetical protein